MSPTQLPLSDHLEPGAFEVECLQAPLRRRALIEKSLENPARDPDRALIGAEDHRELDAVALVIPGRVFGKLRKTALPDFGGRSRLFPLCSIPDGRKIASGRASRDPVFGCLQHLSLELVAMIAQSGNSRAVT